MSEFKKQLKQWSKENGFPQPNEYNNKKKELLSQNELDELMGIHKPVYRRGKGGAFKQK